jgi:hypothetical protein
MAESLALGPTIFTGAPGQDAKTWLASLCDYVAFKDLNDDKKLALFKLRLGETARDWLMALPDGSKDTFAICQLHFSSIPTAGHREVQVCS